jgi:hypothetical protein
MAPLRLAGIEAAERSRACTEFIDNAPAPTVAQALANNLKQVDQAK